MGKVKSAMMEGDSKVTDRQVQALLWLAERGNQGVIDKYGRIVAQGEASNQFMDATWLRLVALGFIHGRRDALSPPRLFITAEGHQFIERNYPNGRP